MADKKTPEKVEKVEKVENTGLTLAQVQALIAEAKAEAKAEALAEFKAAQVDIEKESEKAEANNEARLIAEEKTMKARLLAEKKVSIFIPEDANNSNEPLPIGINGVIFAVPRGVQVEVPESVAAVWFDSYTRTREANRKIKVTEIKDTEVQVLD